MKKRPSALHTKGEMHGCIVCGKLYQIYVVSDANDKFLGCKVMSVGGGPIPKDDHPLAAWGNISIRKLRQRSAEFMTS